MAERKFDEDGRELVDWDDPRVDTQGGFYDPKSDKVRLMKPGEGEALFDRQGSGDN